MGNISQTLDELMKLDGAVCGAVIDYNSGTTLGSFGSGIDLEVAAAGHTEMVRAQMKTVCALGLCDTLDDILITLHSQYHIIRPSAHAKGVFVYFVIDTKVGNLAMARRKVANAERALQV